MHCSVILPGDPKEDLSFNKNDSAPYLPKGIVINPNYDWEDDAYSQYPLSQKLLYMNYTLKALQNCIPVYRRTYAALIQLLPTLSQLIT